MDSSRKHNLQKLNLDTCKEESLFYFQCIQYILNYFYMKNNWNYIFRKSNQNFQNSSLNKDIFLVVNQYKIKYIYKNYFLTNELKIDDLLKSMMCIDLSISHKWSIFNHISHIDCTQGQNILAIIRKLLVN